MLLDVALGLFTAKLVTLYFSLPFSAVYIVAGILFALLPDLDLLRLLSKNRGAGNKDYSHRDLLHYPIPYILIGGVITGLLGGLPLFALFTITMLLHFIHDSIGIGWGIKWLYPFSTKSFAFFYHYETTRNDWKRKILYSWTPDEIDRLSEVGDKNWIKNIYLRPHPYSITEHILTALILVFILLR